MDEMVEHIIEEFIMLGYSDEQILRLFKKTVYKGTNRFYRMKGEDYIRGLIQQVRGQWGIVPRFKNINYGR